MGEIGRQFGHFRGKGTSDLTKHPGGQRFKLFLEFVFTVWVRFAEKSLIEFPKVLILWFNAGLLALF